MSIAKGYTANHKFYDRIGRITPVVEWCESVRPHGGLDDNWTPASWLPVMRQDGAIEEWFVVSAGKVVSLDRQGHLVPAGYRKLWNSLIGLSSAGDIALEYTADDVTEEVTDLTTGVAVTAAVTYTESQVTTALQELGLIDAGERAMDFISHPVGCASYNFFKAAGPDSFNPRTLIKHNVRPQALVAITCDYVMAYPLVPAQKTSETFDTDRSGAGSTAFTTCLTTSRTIGWYSLAQAMDAVRYASLSAATTAVAFVCTYDHVAKNTDDTPIAQTSGTDRLVNLVGDPEACIAAGDYFVDEEVGVIWAYDANGTGVPSGCSGATVAYYHYGTAPSTVSTYACATGDLEYGDMVTFDENSNIIKATLNFADPGGYTGSTAYSADPAYGSGDAAASLQLEQGIMNFTADVIGQVIGVTSYPKDKLDRVRTAYIGQTAANMRTPGMATQGRSDQLTYAGASNKMVIVNLIGR
jgi:hypothetical protein